MTDSNRAIVIDGPAKMSGTVEVSGSKNAALPILAASILSSTGQVKLSNMPMVADVQTLKKAMETLGCSIYLNKNSAVIDAGGINNYVMPPEESRKMRASVLVAGPLLARFGEAIIPQPGGCVIGERPIDMHLMGFRSLGARVERLDNDFLRVSSNELIGKKIDLPTASVGATENIMMAACLAKGKTTITNAAKEPEIVDLTFFLRKMGAKITGAGTSIIMVDGVRELRASTHRIIPDRIEAASFIMAAVATDSELLVKHLNPKHLRNLLKTLSRSGVDMSCYDDSILIRNAKKRKPINVITSCYPGFPTDVQPLLVSSLLLLQGTSIVTDSIFPDRFCYVSQLKKMGADISIYKNSAIVRGVKKIYGKRVATTDLRGGFGMILAALLAEGSTIIEDSLGLINRGYENIDEKFNSLGVKFRRLTSTNDYATSKSDACAKTTGTIVELSALFDSYQKVSN